MKDGNLDRAFFQKYYKPLCFFAWEMVNDSDLAEDLVQDAFTAYWNNRSRVSIEEDSIKAFLYSSVRHAVYNIQRKNKVIQKYFNRLGNNEIDTIDYEHQLITSEFFAELYKIVSALPASCQQIFNLSYVEGLSNQQIADELSISVNTIKTQKQRALKVIRQNLNPELMVVFAALFFC
ncbi:MULTISPECIES: RNA polymerase sigma-70 factor [Sphingobacterium]|uniref:DNA-directed RNA polymerase sigma-70 factor n=1 Tax=Sphingobacterium cellulitidis TaxID=1768011 RepID=A0A8H9FZ16_9SPHI|nr:MULTISPECIES: RNA polymerase sigma-70 factor [Sphingobacterium]MBA8987701.1 RNA polymerase sigma-70 factor (ECF subfamily) [Sphingobacterium soli]WFB64370.1 RNA polymerase sigma-70 factor [Sphingobacterium sp. WM]GGE22330.1 DNA-directed RNA polymerase sigma-70 factor [Sphingobacterium soli]